MENVIILTIASLVLGIYSMAGAVFNWDWFMTSKLAKLLHLFFGRTGTRIAHALIGLIFISFGIFSIFLPFFA